MVLAFVIRHPVGVDRRKVVHPPLCLFGKPRAQLRHRIRDLREILMRELALQRIEDVSALLPVQRNNTLGDVRCDRNGKRLRRALSRRKVAFQPGNALQGLCQFLRIVGRIDIRSI